MHTMETDPIIDWKFKTANNIINVVIVGKVGNGKSATENSILGKECFDSEYSFSAVTCSSELKKHMLKGGRIVNIIDTPGLFNFSTSAEEICGEIVKCISLAKVGIHAVLMVFSLRSQFSIEEVATIESMKSLFGDKIVDYMILVFTNGDVLESTQKSFKDFISHSPEPLQNIIQQCKNRVIVFDNTTKDMIKREEQVNDLLSLVEFIIVDNGGKSYSNKIFAEHKEGALLWLQKVKEVEAKEGCSKEDLSEPIKENIESYDDPQKRVTGIVGHGKSATGNSILESEAFETELDRSRKFCSCDLERVIHKDGRIINVIDTPGFDSLTSFELISEEIIEGINLAKDGIHAVLMVFSLRSCFSTEEEATIECMKSLFGDKIVDYIILVFTNGDILESTQKSLKDFISLSTEPLRNIIQLCKNRVIVFNNTTKDMIKREEQVNELLSLVESVIVDNGGKPYSYKIFAELKVCHLLVSYFIINSCGRCKCLIFHAKERAVEAEERAAQLEAERLGRQSLQDEKIRKLKEDINEKMKQIEEFKKRIAKGKNLNDKTNMALKCLENARELDGLFQRNCLILYKNLIDALKIL
ncbi:hypothetical protein IEQ34_018802 [Dendrobium chrysotoxum]|uniref:AIG1-type G domain-containing protein n=1 Tax=Dendrobium chrysotoxum TaxID=161865 RepID=A0AAV7G817_DENCH|nr:hypothetical protein IEQ34_018802 [Dendrobium chrysotoxum]